MRRRSIDRDGLARVAREYYLNDLSQKEIADLPDIRRGQTTIAQWLRSARDLGIVSIDIDPAFGVAGQESRHLRDRLKDAFDLDDCLVIEPADIRIDHAGDDDLHIAVANATGSRLREWIQSGDHIGIAGGRGVIQVARYLKRRALPRRDIRVSPLSGRIWAGTWQVDVNLQRPLDADDAASLLAYAFEQEPGTSFSQIGHPLYPPVETSRLHEVFEETCAFLPSGGWNWGLSAPNKAIVGLGVLKQKSRHRIVEFLSREERREHGATHLKTVGRDFNELIALATRHRVDVGDISNRLFPTLPLPDERRPRKAMEAAYKLLASRAERLNRRAIVMTWSHLRSIPSVWALSAGRLKQRVLWTVLIARVSDLRHKRKPLINAVSVDATTAKSLIAAKHAFDHPANLQFRLTCEGIVDTVFDS